MGWVILRDRSPKYSDPRAAATPHTHTSAYGPCLVKPIGTPWPTAFLQPLKVTPHLSAPYFSFQHSLSSPSVCPELQTLLLSVFGSYPPSVSQQKHCPSAALPTWSQDASQDHGAEQLWVYPWARPRKSDGPLMRHMQLKSNSVTWLDLAGFSSE